MSIVISNRSYDVPGVVSVSYLENPKIELAHGCKRLRASTTQVQGIVLHSSKGIPGSTDLRHQVMMDGIGPGTNAGERTVGFWTRSLTATPPRIAGAHIIIDADGIVYCTCDLKKEAAFHAGKVNERTIGIEIYQGKDAEFYTVQMKNTAALCDWLCDSFGIPKQVQSVYHGHAIPDLEAGARDAWGVWGHRDCSNNRGAGDPGDYAIQALLDYGFTAVDFALAS